MARIDESQNQLPHLNDRDWNNYKDWDDYRINHPENNIPIKESLGNKFNKSSSGNKTTSRSAKKKLEHLSN